MQQSIGGSRKLYTTTVFFGAINLDATIQNILEDSDRCCFAVSKPLDVNQLLQKQQIMEIPTKKKRTRPHNLYFDLNVQNVIMSFVPILNAYSFER
jgi:hypothetical protein